MDNEAECPHGPFAALIAWLTFIGVAVVELLVNDAVRQAVVGLFS